jgi:hypothetical protein
MRTPRQRLALAWGVGGVALICGRATVNLVPMMLEAFTYDLGPGHWVFLVLWLAFMGYAEGYRGFQKRLAPVVVGRALALPERGTPLRWLLAPWFAMGYFHATKRRLITAWGVTAAIVLVVLGVRLLPQPWRGLVDAGVVLGLGWGTASLLVFGARAMGSWQPQVDPRLPELPDAPATPPSRGTT